MRDGLSFITFLPFFLACAISFSPCRGSELISRVSGWHGWALSLALAVIYGISFISLSWAIRCASFHARLLAVMTGLSLGRSSIPWHGRHAFPRRSFITLLVAVRESSADSRKLALAFSPSHICAEADTLRFRLLLDAWWHYDSSHGYGIDDLMLISREMLMTIDSPLFEPFRRWLRFIISGSFYWIELRRRYLADISCLAALDGLSARSIYI